MKKFLIKNKKNISLVLIAVIASGFVFLPLPVSAADDPVTWLVKTFIGISADALLFASSFVSYIIGSFLGIFLYLEAQIIDYLLTPENFPITNARIVQVGWSITRDLANMFFILILLIIAFATVLKIQSYAIKQLWWKVLVAALLINFSLVIAGFVVDFTNILTTFFIKTALAGDDFWTVTTRLMASMQILNFYNPARASDILGGISQFGAAGIAAFVGIVLTLIGLVVAVFVFGAAAVFLTVRILYLWLLLIFAPIIWMLWILPATSQYFSQWWDSFIKWAFFAPIYAFMIYLSLQMFDKTGELNVQVGGLSFPANWFKGAPGLTTAAMPAAIFQWLLVIAMMFGSLIVAQKFGVHGADASQKMLKGWGTSTKNWAGRQLRRQALGVGAREAAPGVKARPGLLVRGAQKLAAMPGGRLLAGQVFKMTAGEAGTTEDAQKQFANWTPEAIQEYLKKSPGRITSPFVQNQQMGAALALKEQGKLDKVGEPRIKELAALASRQYPKQLDEILKVAPHLATEFNKKIKEVVAKIDKADQIMLSSLANSDVVINLNPNQLKDIVQKADDVKVQRVKTVVESEFARLPGTIPTDLNNIIRTTNKEARNRALNDFMNKQLTAGVPREEVQRYEKVARSKATTNSPAWAI
ncbi:MAG: hypothetical protein AAB642_03955 [Patescibacteria group bacterium]